MVTILVLVTLLSLGLAAIMSVVALRSVREGRRRSDARVAALARDITGEDLPLHRDPGVSASGLFAEIQEHEKTSRVPVTLAAGAAIVAVAFALAVVLSGGRPSAFTRIDAGRGEQETVAGTPLELIELGHERTADRLTIRGAVLNPQGGREVEPLTALVVLVAKDGRELASGRAPVSGKALQPDTQTTFVVTVPDAPGVARYRVSFEADGRVMPHIDRRAAR
jgi:hypothetical protein